MQTNEGFSWRARGRSFRYAWQGIVALVRDEHNARIHLCAAVVAIGLGAWLGISRLEWVAIVMCIALVLAAEALNSAVEALCDRFGAERHPLIGKAKDTAAAAVLLTAAGAAAAGAIIFLPRLWTIIMEFFP
ncbi:MAG: diacylglycerol kinase family protein [Muribaculaceae bacterium]|nr:diacylglycerol kinase family protein [Muribaculaceae bacterium]